MKCNILHREKGTSYYYIGIGRPYKHYHAHRLHTNWKYRIFLSTEGQHHTTLHMNWHVCPESAVCGEICQIQSNHHGYEIYSPRKKPRNLPFSQLESQCLHWKSCITWFLFHSIAPYSLIEQNSHPSSVKTYSHPTSNPCYRNLATKPSSGLIRSNRHQYEVSITWQSRQRLCKRPAPLHFHYHQ